MIFFFEGSKQKSFGDAFAEKFKQRSASTDAEGQTMTQPFALLYTITNLLDLQLYQTHQFRHLPHFSPTMRATRTLLAKASTVGTPSGGLGVVPHALLPPIPLYRRLLRGHRKHLPPEMRVLGDEYVKAEFRAHRGVDNPIHIVSICLRP